VAKNKGETGNGKEKKQKIKPTIKTNKLKGSRGDLGMRKMFVGQADNGYSRTGVESRGRKEVWGKEKAQLDSRGQRKFCGLLGGKENQKKANELSMSKEKKNHSKKRFWKKKETVGKKDLKKGEKKGWLQLKYRFALEPGDLTSGRVWKEWEKKRKF